MLPTHTTHNTRVRWGARPLVCSTVCTGLDVLGGRRPGRGSRSCGMRWAIYSATSEHSTPLIRRPPPNSPHGGTARARCRQWGDRRFPLHRRWGMTGGVACVLPARSTRGRSGASGIALRLRRSGRTCTGDSTSTLTGATSAAAPRFIAPAPPSELGEMGWWGGGGDPAPEITTHVPASTNVRGNATFIVSPSHLHNSSSTCTNEPQRSQRLHSEGRRDIRTCLKATGVPEMERVLSSSPRLLSGAGPTTNTQILTQRAMSSSAALLQRPLTTPLLLRASHLQHPHLLLPLRPSVRPPLHSLRPLCARSDHLAKIAQV
jgi:hypothetical protein